MSHGIEGIGECRCEEINEFLRNKASVGRQQQTLEKYARTLNRFFHDYFPDKTPDEITVRDMEQYLQYLEADFDSRVSSNDSITNKTKKDYLLHLSSFYDWAMKRPRFENITGNPAAIVADEITFKRRERPEVATWENAEKIVKVCDDPRNRVLAAFYLKTGVRLKEALEVTWKDVDTEEGFVRLPWRKGGGTGVVPIDEEMSKVFERFDLMRRFQNIDYIFVSREGNQLGPDRSREIVRHAAVEAGVMEKGETDFHRKFTPHTFRTVFTTTMKREGCPRRIIRAIRDDSKGRSMDDWYDRVSREEMREEYVKHIPKIGL